MTLERLLGGLGQLEAAHLSCLYDTNWVASAIRRTGVCGEGHGRLRYRDDCTQPIRLGAMEGIFQRADELAPFLTSLAGERIASYLEVGTWTGWCSAFVTTYLRRFVPHLQAMTIDPAPRLPPWWKEIEARTGLRHVPTTSHSLAGNAYDLVFIDADHTYPAVKADYSNVGQHARICAFHDIQDESAKAACLLGGTVAFWREVSQGRRHVEYCLPREDRWMGIGVLYHEE